MEFVEDFNTFFPTETWRYKLAVLSIFSVALIAPLVVLCCLVNR